MAAAVPALERRLAGTTPHAGCACLGRHRPRSPWFFTQSTFWYRGVWRNRAGRKVLAVRDGTQSCGVGYGGARTILLAHREIGWNTRLFQDLGECSIASLQHTLDLVLRPRVEHDRADDRQRDPESAMVRGTANAHKHAMANGSPLWVLGTAIKAVTI